MPRPSSRFIKNLTEQEIQELANLKDHGSTPRIRHRAHAILLSHEGTSVIELIRIFQSNRTTICLWLDRWDSNGLKGLADGPRPGSPPKLSESELIRAVELLKESPHNPALVLSQIQKETGKEISRSTLKRIARKAGLIWKRMRKSLESKRDQKNFAT